MRHLLLIGASIISFFLLPLQAVWAVPPAATISADLSITTHVKQRPQDIQFQLTPSIVDAEIGADTEVEYTITYGSRLKYPTPMTIEADWSLGRVVEDNLFSYSIISYVAGSATKDYWGATTPVVDIVHRKITWEVARFPQNTIDKTLKFKLKTPGRYVTDKNVAFSVTAKLKTPEASMPDITLDQIYNPGKFIASQVAGLHIIAADIRSITSNSFALNLTTSVPTRTVIYYGQTQDLDKTFKDDTLADQKLLTIDGLSPGTTYYFKILIENALGIQRKTPEFLTVTTSTNSLLSLLDPERITISTQGILLKQTSGVDPNERLVVPTDKLVDFFLPFRGTPPSIVYLSLLNKRVLGASIPPVALDNGDPSPAKIRLVEIQPNLFSGRMKMPATLGLYDAVLEAQSVDGATNQDILTTFQVARPFVVIGSGDRVLEKAYVYLERFNIHSGAFEYFPSETFGFFNPNYTEADGTMNMALPVGTYRVNVQALGYKPYQTTFDFDPTRSQAYPRMVMVAAPFDIMNYIRYYWNVFHDGLALGNRALDKLAGSFRYLDLMLTVGVIVVTVMSFFLNLHRVKLSFEGFVMWLAKIFFSWRRHRVLDELYIGFAEDYDTGLPVHGATVVLTIKGTKVGVAHDMTSTFGEFRVPVALDKQYQLVIRKLGYETIAENISIADILEAKTPFRMVKETRPALHPAIFVALYIVHAILHSVSDTLLLAVIVIQVLLIYRLGVLTVFPMLLLTLFSVGLWLEYHWGQIAGRLSSKAWSQHETDPGES